MEYHKLKEEGKEVIVDVASHEVPLERDSISGNVWVSLNKFVGGLLNYNRGPSVRNSHETLELLVDKNPRSWHSKERRKSAKPPRHPNGPTLNAADIRLVKEITRASMKKKEKMQSAKFSSKGSTILASIITILFLLIVVFQGSGSGSNPILAAAPQPAQDTWDLATVLVNCYL